MDDESIDLIYLDPPFNSNRAYNITYPDSLGQVKAFDDTWFWSRECDIYLQNLQSHSIEVSSLLSALVRSLGKTQMCAYLVNMAIRLVEMKRIMKKTGSIYLHCDPTASHYLKIMLDSIFGYVNFRNEIIWHYRRWSNSSSDFLKMHDVILRYSKTKKSTWNILFQPYSDDKYIENTVRERVDGKLVRKKDEKGKYVRRIKENKGVPLHDVWHDINYIAPTAKERLGYPTQKPLALLERIIKASSNKGDIVLDPFCGCGTTVSAAERLHRNWIGIDITYSSIAAIQERFKKEGLVSMDKIHILGKPETIKEVENTLLNKASPLYARKEFEKFIVTTIGGLPNDKMGADGGIDGRILLDNDEVALCSVKSGHVSRSQIVELAGLFDKKNVAGIFVTKEKPTKPMIEFAKQAGFHIPVKNKFFECKPFPKLQILTLDDVLAGKRPFLSIQPIR